jgi:hypothetical protein
LLAKAMPGLGDRLLQQPPVAGVHARLVDRKEVLPGFFGALCGFAQKGLQIRTVSCFSAQ